MNRPQSESIARSLFFTILGLTAFVYLLRGLSWLSFLPGGILWLLLLSAIASGIYYAIERSRRF